MLLLLKTHVHTSGLNLIGRIRLLNLKDVHIPVSELNNIRCGVVSREGEPDKGETLSQEPSTVFSRKVREPILLVWLKRIKVGGVVRASDGGDVGREDWGEGREEKEGEGREGEGGRGKGEVRVGTRLQYTHHQQSVHVVRHEDKKHSPLRRLSQLVAVKNT